MPTYATQTRLWPLRVIWAAVTFTWWRGLYYPVADLINIICWYYGWGAHRWKARPGDIITVHGIPAMVCGINHRTLTVTTDTGEHHRPKCCTPWESPL